MRQGVTLILTAVALYTFSTLPASAKGWYVGGKMGAIELDDDQGYETAINIEGIFGYSFNRMFSVEGGFSTTAFDGSLEVPSLNPDTMLPETIELDVDFEVWSLYGVFRSPGPFYVKAKAGAANTNIDIEGVEADDTEGSFGIGGGYQAPNGMRFELEYTQIAEDIDFVSFGISSYFSGDYAPKNWGQQKEPKFYFGFNYATTEFALEDGSLEDDTTGIGFKFGRELSPYINIETHIGLSSISSSNILEDPEVTYLAALLRLNLPFEKVNLYLLGGGSIIRYDFPSANDEESRAAGGIGIELFGSPNTAFTIDLMRYGTDSTLDTLSFGFIHRFKFARLR